MDKFCNKCLEKKDIELFYKRKDSPDGYRNECKKCKNKLNKDINKEYYKLYQKEYKKKYREENKEKLKIDRVKYYEGNKESYLEKGKVYYENNKSQKMARRKEWRNENRDRINEFYRDKRKNDLLWALKTNIRTLIGNSLKDSGYSKSSRTEQILECSYEEFKAHIESQFLPDMSWNNREEWHIDHIIPLSFARNELELIQLNNFKNLRPLWIKAITISDSGFFNLSLT